MKCSLPMLGREHRHPSGDLNTRLRRRIVSAVRVLKEREGNMMAEKILLVDDDGNILEGYRRSLSREFLMETAEGGPQALALATDRDHTLW